MCFFWVYFPRSLSSGYRQHLYISVVSTAQALPPNIQNIVAAQTDIVYYYYIYIYIYIYIYNFTNYTCVYKMKRKLKKKKKNTDKKHKRYYDNFMKTRIISRREYDAY